MTIDIRIGDSRKLIHELPDASVDLVVTSPPYWGLRDYKTEPIIFDGSPDCEHEWEDRTIIRRTPGDIPGASSKVAIHRPNDSVNRPDIKQDVCIKCGAWRGQLGLEPTPELFIKHLLDFFGDVKLKLKTTGCCFVNIGDTYATHTGKRSGQFGTDITEGNNSIFTKNRPKIDTPEKCLCLIPERFVIGMVERGWIARNKPIWWKPNHMPESVTDRFTKSYENIYFFTKSRKYYFNLDAVREQHKYPDDVKRRIRQDHEDDIVPFAKDNHDGIKWRRDYRDKHADSESRTTAGLHENRWGEYFNKNGKNPGDVWQVTTQPYAEAHFATFPLELVRRPILAGCPENGTVLDPFAGSGTVGEFCRNHNRNAILFELNPDYKRLIVERTMSNIPSLESYEVKA